MVHYRLQPLIRYGRPPDFWLVYTLATVASFIALFVSYSNSSYLESFVTPVVVSMLFLVGSLSSVVALLLMPLWLQRWGNYWVAIGLSIVQVAALTVMGFGHTALTIVPAFLCFLTVSPMLYFSIDIFSETLIGNNENSTGKKRGLTLALMSAASVCGPLMLAFIVGQDDTLLYRAYLAAATVGVFLTAIILFSFYSFTDQAYHPIKPLRAIRTAWQNSAIKRVAIVHLVLQLFFAWTVIYIPLYLITDIGYTWDKVGSIIAFGLFAYVIFEFPVGYLADACWGEKEMMTLGVAILVVTVMGISFMAEASILGWMVLMFVNRIGASLVEVTTESYFFKQTNGRDAQTISLFRLLRPLGTLLGTLLGTIALLFMPLSQAFILLGVVLALALFPIASLVDTK